MSEITLEAELAAAATAEAEAVRTLHELNAQYIRAFVESDTVWYREHLSDDFACTLADGRRIAKDEFLKRNAEGPGATDVTYDQIDVQPLGDTALVHLANPTRLPGDALVGTKKRGPRYRFHNAHGSS